MLSEFQVPSTFSTSSILTENMNGTTQELPERLLKTELSQYGRRRATDGAYADNLDLDVLVVGAGFSGIYLLYELRKQGYNVKIFDAGLSFGGTWSVHSLSHLLPIMRHS